MMRGILVIVALLLFAAPELRTQSTWLLRIEGGVLFAGGDVGPASAELDDTRRVGARFGAGLEKVITNGWTVAVEGSWQERGIERYFRLQKVEERRFRGVELTVLGRWAPIEATLAPTLAFGAGLALLQDAYIQYGFHERFNFLQGTEGLRTTVPFLSLGVGFRLDAGRAVRLDGEISLREALCDFHPEARDAALHFRFRDIVAVVAVGIPL